MSAKIFLKIGNIKGESTDSKHKDEIDVFSWSWGVSYPVIRGLRRWRWSWAANFQRLKFHSPL